MICTVLKKTICFHLYVICLVIIIITGGCGDGGGDSNTSGSLQWDPPTTNTDGTDLTDLAGYKIYYGTSPGTYEPPVNVGTVTTYSINDLSLPPATYYFAVTADDEMGNESAYSNEVSKTMP